MRRLARRIAGPLWLLAVLALLVWPVLALAQTAPVEAPTPELISYLMGLGPIGALVYGAWLLGRGVNVTVTVVLAEGDRALLTRGVEALEAQARRLPG